MTRPRPAALRLVAPRSAAKAPKPPFGLRAWSPAAESVAVLLDAGHASTLDLPSVLLQVPHATELSSSRTPLVLLDAAVTNAGVLRRLLGGGTVRVSRAIRCSALVARGYIDVGGGIDESTGSDLAWGWSP